MSRPSQWRRAGRARRAGSAAVLLVQLFLALVVALALLAFIASRSGRLQHVAHVADDRVGVLVDHRRGELRAIEHTGYQFLVPGLETVQTLARSPLEYLMEGGERLDANRVPYLVVRARDGSRLWFDRVAIQYQVDAERAERALRDFGQDEELRAGLVDAYARAVLQEEFGRFSAGEIVLPENRRTAVEQAQERLVALLTPHGIALREVSVSKPRFEDRYEQTIERRKVAEQEIERLELEAEGMRAGQAEEERRFERKLELQLAKDSDLWTRELQDLRHAAQVLSEGRAEGLERLERQRGLALAAARADWTRRRNAAEAELAALERTRAPRLEALRGEKLRMRAALEVDLGQRSSASLRRLELLAEARPGHLERLRREGELTRRTAESQATAELLAAHAEALRLVSEAEGHAAQRDQQAALEASVRRGRAEVLLARHAGEARNFRALAQALEATGEAGVRSALVDVLAGVEFQLAPTARAEEPASATRSAARH